MATPLAGAAVVPGPLGAADLVGPPVAWATVIAALLAGLVAAMSLAYTVMSTARNRRRDLYSQAYRITMSWIEMAYRAYHAAPGDRSFLDGYHRHWEDVRYYEGWLLFESRELGYSFARFKSAVEQVCDRFIEDAWLKRTAEPKPLGMLPVEATPETFQDELNFFLQDARDQLSLKPWKRAAMRRRVRKRIKTGGGVHVSGLPVSRD